MLTVKNYGVSEIRLANSTDITSFAALLTACSNSIALTATKYYKCLAYGRNTTTYVKGLAEAVDYDECGPKEVAAGRVLPHDVLVPQLDGHQSPEQLAQLFDQQVELSPGFEGEDNLRKEKDETFQSNGEVLKDKICDANNPYKIKEVKAAEVRLCKYQTVLKLFIAECVVDIDYISCKEQ